jgi:hypothetical protein
MDDGGIFAVGWGLLIPLLWIFRRDRMRRDYHERWVAISREEELVNVARLYLNGTLTREELIQALERIKTRNRDA